MTINQLMIKKIYGGVLLIFSFIFLSQAILDQEFIPAARVFIFLGLSKNIIFIFLSMFVCGVLGSLFDEKIKTGVIPHSPENQKKANRMARSFMVSFLSLWFTMVIFQFWLGTEIIQTTVNNNQSGSVLSFLTLSNNQLFLNLYLFWFLLFSGLFGNIWEIRAVTDLKEQEKIMKSINRWKKGKSSFGEMIKEQKMINKETKDNK